MTKTNAGQSFLADSSASHGIAPGVYSGSWSGYDLRVETPTKLFNLETRIGIRGYQRVVVRVATDGTLTTQEIQG